MIGLLLAGAMIVTPGEGLQYIVPTAEGYNVIRLGEEAGVTQVTRVGNTTNIISPDAPTTFIYGNDEVLPTISVDE